MLKPTRTSTTTNDWIGWAFQSAVIGLTCGIGYGIVRRTFQLQLMEGNDDDDDDDHEKEQRQIRRGCHCYCHWNNNYLTNFFAKLGNFREPNRLLFWMFVTGTCPHSWIKWAWYPLVMCCFNAEQPTPKEDDDQQDETQHTHNITIQQPSKDVVSSPNDVQDSVDILKTPLRTNKHDTQEQQLQRKNNVLPEMPFDGNGIGATTTTTTTAATATAEGDATTVSSNSSSLAKGESSTAGGGGRYVEMLVHNVSHTDLVLGVNAPLLSDDDTMDDGMTAMTDKYCLCRPRFSAFDLYSRRILTSLDQQSSSHQRRIASFPRYERSDDRRYTIVTPRPSRKAMLPTGFQLEEDSTSPVLCIPPQELMNLRFRRRDARRIEPYLQTQTQNSHPKEPPQEELLRFNYVFFPLLATLLPRWHQSVATKYSNSGDKLHNIKKVLILVTGVGTPRNWTHSITGNSTQACAQLMERYISELYPDVTVRLVHSESNIFRYDENIEFANHELMPCIDAYRDAHARQEPYPDEKEQQQQQQLSVGGGGGGGSSNDSISNNPSPFNTEWKQSFAVTLSFADGSPARTHAIQASLRPYRPSYFHFWQLKTFWHDTKICEDDIEVHSFEDMETVPAMEVSQTNKREQTVVEEMKRFREEFLETVNSHQNDIRQFWLRKTKKPVLAILLVEHPEKGPVLYRGTNMEVSMPTGSLCAERNVIGTALAANPDLKREYLSMVAVLAVPLAPPPPADDKSPLLCQEILPAKPENIRRSMSVNSFASILEDDDQHEDDAGWVLENATSSAILAAMPKEGNMSTNSAMTAPANVVTVKRSSPDCSPALGPDVPPAFKLPPSAISTNTTPKQSPPGTPRRLIALHNSSRLPSSADDMIGADPATTKASSSVAATCKNTPKGNSQDTTAKKKKKTIIVHSNEDLNPLRPCGACNEWLKKIAESNPRFKVITFTDADCNGVYVSPCQE